MSRSFSTDITISFYLCLMAQKTLALRVNCGLRYLPSLNILSFLLSFGIAQLLFLLFNFEHNFLPIIAGFIYIYPRAANFLYGANLAFHFTLNFYEYG